MLKIHYNIDNGLTKFLEVKMGLGTTIYHQDQECTKHALLDAVYRVVSENGAKVVGKITIIHASF